MAKIVSDLSLGNHLWHCACSDFSRSASDASLWRMSNTPHSLTSHNPENSLTILECQEADNSHSAPHSQGVSVAQSVASLENEVSLESNTAKQSKAAASLVNTRIVLESSLSLRGSGESHNEIHNKNMDCHETRCVSRNDEPTESSELGEKGISFFAVDSNGRTESAQTLKASSGWGIAKGEGATSQFKPLPLSQKEKSESLETRKTTISDSVKKILNKVFKKDTSASLKYDTHPLTPSAREGECVGNPTARESLTQNAKDALRIDYEFFISQSS